MEIYLKKYYKMVLILHIYMNNKQHLKLFLQYLLAKYQLELQILIIKQIYLILQIHIYQMK